jgi:hypothetical protein
MQRDGLSLHFGSRKQIFYQRRSNPTIPVLRQESNVDQRYHITLCISQDSADWLLVQHDDLIVSYRI